jgi:hypothetical protein
MNKKPLSSSKMKTSLPMLRIMDIVTGNWKAIIKGHYIQPKMDIFSIGMYILVFDFFGTIRMRGSRSTVRLVGVDCRPELL